MFKNKLFHVYLFIGYKKKAVINLLLLCFIILFIHYSLLDDFAIGNLVSSLRIMLSDSDHMSDVANVTRI